MQKTISATVLGRSYPLRVDEEHERFTHLVVGVVDERAQRVAADAPGHPPLTHMALTALSLGEELLTLREELGRLRAFEDEAARLASRLERALENGEGRPAAGTRRKPRTTSAANPARRAAVPQTTHSGADAEPPATAPAEGAAPPAEE